MGNQGWKCIAEMVPDSYDVFQFEKYFCNWQKEAILLTEITYAETYSYITPLGVYTHIGTLARALQHTFEKGWEVNASLVGDELSFSVNKHIKGCSHSYVCHFVELDQAYSVRHCDGWKLEANAGEFQVNSGEVMNIINSLSALTLDSELSASVNFGNGDNSIRIRRLADGSYLLTRVPNPPEEPVSDKMPDASDLEELRQALEELKYAQLSEYDIAP